MSVKIRHRVRANLSVREWVCFFIMGHSPFLLLVTCRFLFSARNFYFIRCRSSVIFRVTRRKPRLLYIKRGSPRYDPFCLPPLPKRGWATLRVAGGFLPPNRRHINAQRRSRNATAHNTQQHASAASEASAEQHTRHRNAPHPSHPSGAPPSPRRGEGLTASHAPTAAATHHLPITAGDHRSSERNINAQRCSRKAAARNAHQPASDSNAEPARYAKHTQATTRQATAMPQHTIGRSPVVRACHHARAAAAKQPRATPTNRRATATPNTRRARLLPRDKRASATPLIRHTLRVRHLPPRRGEGLTASHAPTAAATHHLPITAGDHRSSERNINAQRCSRKAAARNAHQPASDSNAEHAASEASAERHTRHRNAPHPAHPSGAPPSPRRGEGLTASHAPTAAATPHLPVTAGRCGHRPLLGGPLL